MDNRIEKLADFMGWELSYSGDVWVDKEAGECLRDDFNPLKDWNDMRMVEDALFERGLWRECYAALCYMVCGDPESNVWDYTKVARATLEQRVDAALAVIGEME